MGIFNWKKFPYTNFHELNLDYFINKFNEIFAEWENLYNTLNTWKDDTTTELEAWKTATITELEAWETDTLSDLNAWKYSTETDISAWETATLSALNAWKNATETVFEQIRTEAAASATAAAGSATAAAGSATAAAGSATTAQNTVDKINSEIYYNQINYINYVKGSIATANGTSGTLARARSADYMQFDNHVIIINSDTENYNYTLFKYNEPNTHSGSYIGYEVITDERYEISDTKYYRIMGKKNNNENFTDADVEAFSSIVYYEKQINKINEKANQSEVNNKVNLPFNGYGTYGQILSTRGNGDTEWINPAQPSEQLIINAVNDWLTDHPEVNSGIITPIQFNAVGNGVADDSIAIQNAINYAVENNLPIVDGMGKTYVVSGAVHGPNEEVYNDGHLNYGLYVHGNIIFRNFNLKLKDSNNVQLTSILNVYNDDDEITVISNIHVDGNKENQDSVPTGYGQDGGFHGIRIGFAHDCGTIIIENCEIKNCYTDGIVTRPVNYINLIISNCHIFGSGRDGITDNAKNNYIINCIFDYNGTRGGALPQSGYRIEPDGDANLTTVLNRKKLENCTIKNNFGTDFTIYFNKRVYEIEKLELENCNIGNISISNHCINQEEITILHEFIIDKTTLNNISYLSVPTEQGGTTYDTRNKFEKFEILNSLIGGNVVIEGSGELKSGTMIINKSDISGTVDIERVSYVYITESNFTSDDYAINCGNYIDNIIINANNFIYDGSGTVIDLSYTVNAIFTNNISTVSQSDLLDRTHVVNSVVANNIFGS